MGIVAFDFTKCLRNRGVGRRSLHASRIDHLGGVALNFAAGEQKRHSSNANLQLDGLTQHASAAAELTATITRVSDMVQRLAGHTQEIPTIVAGRRTLHVPCRRRLEAPRSSRV